MRDDRLFEAVQALSKEIAKNPDMNQTEIEDFLVQKGISKS
jgi:uncharacterized protein YneF (UPF0154 family)